MLEIHPSYPALASVAEKYPTHRGSLFQTYNDILLAQQWRDVQVIDLGKCKRGALQGRRPRTAADADLLLHIVPCSLAESISLAWYDAEYVFAALVNPPSIYLAVVSDDSSIVYYKLSSGIVKPSI
ncbi:tRNA intron endonuclease [Lentinula edodes]|uniref:tRNA intron endonuclease n=1 Tax=Lentinula edodes TaxID=5353 RepID=UPI001E8D8DD4|nr:tRNA intron endonuclease [Lentinula edodes]KAH7876432.1 tRNA intron endonuclease [Lentinula edodes]